jgi:hypothetical protein
VDKILLRCVQDMNELITKYSPMKSRTKLILFFLSLSMLNACDNGKQDADATKYLLLDKRIIEKTENAKLEVGKVEKHAANPLFGEDKEWEMRFDNLYGNVMFDENEKLYKCWYSPFIVDHSSKGMTLEDRQVKYPEGRGIEREMGICYATSKDGIKWDKPNLGLIEYNGSKQNNIVWRGPHGAGIFKDLHENDPDRRFKMIIQGLAVSYSADGIHWTDKVKVKGVSVAGDTHNNALWAPTLNKYVGITRTWIKKEGRIKREREVARIESDDFENWTKEETVLQGEEYDLQPYAMPTFYYAGVYLGLVAIHEQSSDKVWTELTWSPDTKKWYRIDAGNPLIPTSEKKLDYDYGCVYACAYPIIKKNQIQLYYGGSDWLHYGWRNGSLNLATLRPDGFAGYVQKNRNQEGVIETKLISYKGGALKLTADVEKGGSIKVTVLNSDGGQIATSKSITKTITDEMLQLNNKIKEENISLKIEIKKAKVYSFSIE